MFFTRFIQTLGMNISEKRTKIAIDKTVSNILIAHGFRMISNISGTYTFINEAPEKFSFDSIDSTKIYFTNKINL